MKNKFRVLDTAGQDITSTLSIPEGSRVVGAVTKAESIELKDGKVLYARANEEGITFSQYLERMDPSEEGAKLDAYGRQLKRFNIVPKSIPSRGIYCSTGQRFFQADQPTSSVLFPEFISRTARMALIAPSMVDEMVGSVRPIVGDTYKEVLITWTQANVKKRRVTQGADFPEVSLSWADQAASVYKYGRKIKATYEFVRRMSLDLLSTTINLIMVESRNAEADDAVSNLTTGIDSSYIYAANGANGLDPGEDTAATPRNISYKAWIKFAMKFSPYKANVVVGNEDALVEFITMTKPGADPFELLASLRQGPETINIRLAQQFWGPVTLIYNSTVTKWDLVAFQKEYALERIVEIGADLAETDKLISTQFHRIVISESQNFGKVFPQCIRILRMN